MKNEALHHKILLSARDVKKEFSGSQENEQVLKNIDLDIYEGDFTVIMGASGAGKSTLLYALSGMDSVTDGKVLYKGKEISAYKEQQMAKLRSRDFGFVFQYTHLVSSLTLEENIRMAGLICDSMSEKETNEKTDALIRQMCLEKAKDRLPAQVSGGEAQRAAVARAVITKPTILFADEPTGALNKANTEEALNLLTALHAEGQSILLVTHDRGAALRGNRILYLEDGAIVGELTLSHYQGKSIERERELASWLEGFRW